MTITFDRRSVFGLAVVTAIAAIAFVAFQSVTANAVTQGESTFVAMTPCRLFDTRPGGVGVRNTPLRAGETHEFQVTGTNGDCTIPSQATAVSVNLTGAKPTANTNLRVFPAGTAVPNASAANMRVGQGPTPNKLDVQLSSDGKVAIYNSSGSIDVIGDVMGYYRSDGLSDLEARLAALEAANGDLQAEVSALQSHVADLESLTASMTLETVDGQPTVRFSGVNVQVVNGAGDSFAAPNALGNLILGYNESNDDTRTGSHNLVVGFSHSYTSSSGLVVGRNHTISGFGASVTGGDANRATGNFAVVSGGTGNVASGRWSTVSGGWKNTAGDLDTVVGGDDLICVSAFPQAVSCGEGSLDPAD